MLGLTVAMSPPAAADFGIDDIGETACYAAGGPLVGGAMLANKWAGLDLPGGDLCEKVGDKTEKVVNEAWDEIKEGALGAVIESLTDVTKWVIRKVLTVALMGPSVDLKATGLFGGGENATLAGMLYWLGLVIAAGGVMWQVGKMAVTGQAKHLGRAAVGWGENLLLSTIGVALFALLLTIGDALANGLVEATFDDKAYDRILKVLLPVTVQNPMTMLGLVSVLLLVGFVQLVMVFLRQSAIPFICLLLPVAGGGRAGGDATRQWAPKLITSGLVIIFYKPVLAVIICTGFAEFGKAQTLAEWLRGVATLVLGVIAPVPLMKVFAPFGEVAGGGMASGGMSSALGAAASYMGGKKGSEQGGEGEAPATPVSHSKWVERSMPDPDSGGSGQPDSGKGGDGPDRGAGDSEQSTQAHAKRNEANQASIPGQQSEGGSEGALNGVQAGTEGAGTSSATAGAGTAAAVAVAGGIQVLDGVNDAVQNASGEMGGGNRHDDA
ncbi:hypothetical protein [Streptomyces sp. NPDC013181]|uniref:hypothetical protein n=1 Tax=Streptomyces sp. NPDC013181 TaxID=3364864 RepID=UPI0036A3798D